MTMGNPPFEAADPIEHVDFAMSCWFSGVYMFINGSMFQPDMLLNLSVKTPPRHGRV